MLTKKQKEVLDYIRQFSKEKEYAPSLEDIKKHFKLASVSTAHYYVNKLQKDGYLKKESNQPRAISVQEDDFVASPPTMYFEMDSMSLPVLGAANCGVAEVLAIESPEAYLKVSKDVVKKKDGVFVLRATGDSMNQANIKGNNIEEGDYVLIDSESKSVNNGDYVLSIIDGCANLKKFVIDKKKRRMLVPESSNIEHKPILISSADDFMVNGRILAVVKQ